MADNWDMLGMRGTASDDVVLTDVFVPQERVLADRPYGVIDPPLQVIASIAFLDHLGRVPRCGRGRIRRGAEVGGTAVRTTRPCSARSA